MGLFRIITAGGQGFLSIVSDQADHAGAGHWWRQVAGRSAGATDQAGGDKRVRDRVERYRTLDIRGTAQGYDRRPGKVSLTFTSKPKKNCVPCAHAGPGSG